MTSSLLKDPEFLEWFKLPEGSGYRKTPVWSHIGACKLDQKLTRLADLYLNSDPKRRQLIHNFFEGQRARFDEMWHYVRRVAKLILSKNDVGWLRRGLPVAAIEGGRIDYRDTIVSLVILRYATERVGIKTRPFFTEAMKAITRHSRGSFANARDHDQADVIYTIEEFGPPDWVRELESPHQ